ncbi:MAG: T9SS type A sorting domain-containing protein [Ginsengibacter sp.]
MKKTIINLFFFILCCIFNSSVLSQPFKRICVIGSSTAWGYFRDPNPPYNPLYPRDSAWTFKLSKYYKDLGLIDTLFNIASIGTDPYTGMPSSYTPPAQRNLPDGRYNITMAVNLVPKPDVIIVNYPSNNFEWQTDLEILFCLQTIKDSANAKGIQCYITTTQPRNTFSASERQKLKDLRDIILNRFGQYAIDFFTDITEVPSLNILPMYSLGDGIHTNPEGQTVLEQEVLSKNILLNTLPVSFMDFRASKQNESVKLSWMVSADQNIDHFIVERSSNSKDFNQIGDLRTTQSAGNQNYSFEDKLPFKSINYFRIVLVEKDNKKIFSKVIPVVYSANEFFVSKIYPIPAENEINIRVFSAAKGELSFSIINNEGKTVKRETLAAQPDMLYNTNIANFAKGTYTLLIQNDFQKRSIGFVK